jgi:hypothetical protein
MGQRKNKKESLLQELIEAAKRLNIEVRTEKLLREVGYHARSGRCRVRDQELIILDKDSPLGDQVDFLAAALSEKKLNASQIPPHLTKIIKPKPSLKEI